MNRIKFEVVFANGDKIFQVTGYKELLFINKILFVWFEGYHHRTKCEVIRIDEPYDSGYISYHGTHAASEYGMGFKKITTQEMISEIRAEDLEVGDIVEIENITKKDCRSYKSVDAFINYVETYKNFSDSFDAALEFKGKLTGEELLNLLTDLVKNGSSKIDKVTIIKL